MLHMDVLSFADEVLWWMVVFHGGFPWWFSMVVFHGGFPW